MKKFALIALSLGIFSCDAQTQTDVARTTAKSILNPIVQSKFPGQNSEVIVNCAVDNASKEEIISLGASAATGNSAQTTSVATKLISKPATIECVAKDSLAKFGF